MNPRRLLALLLLLFAASVRPAGAADALPPGVVARVHGRDIREADLLERLARRWGSTDRGKNVLDQLVDDTCVAIEASKRSVSVTEAEVAAYVKKVDDTIRQQTGDSRTIDDIYREQRSNPAEFARIAHEYLKRQKMAAEDLGTKPGEEVPEARLKLWLSALRRRAGVKMTDLPDGVLATVGETTIDRTTFARALKEQLPEETSHAALVELVMDAATDHALEAAHIVVSDADVDADLARLRERFSKDPRVKNTGLTFDEFLKQTQGTSEAELRTDRRYRASIGLDRLLGRSVSDEQVRKQWTENRDAYGERALVRQIYVPAGEAGGKFQMRSFAEAKERALQAKVAVLEGSGGLGQSGEARKPLRDVVTSVAKQFEEDAQKKQGAGEPVAWTRVNLVGEDELAAAVFQGEIGSLLGPKRSRVGYHLLFVEERRPAPTFDDVKDSVREDLLRVEMQKFKIAMRGDPDVVLPK